MIKLHLWRSENLNDETVRVSPGAIVDYYQTEAGCHPNFKLATYIHIDNRESLYVIETPSEIDAILETAEKDKEK